jgi:hypothetical protein
MKNATLLLFGLAGACAACCALPAIGALLAGTVLTTASLASLGWAGVATGITFALILLWRRRTAMHRGAKATEKACGCPQAQNAQLLIAPTVRAAWACALTPAALDERLDRIKRLAGRALLGAERGPLSLHLTYARHAAADVRQLVRDEQICCAFLRFNLREDIEGVHVSVSVPEEAREAADVLLAPFMPHLAYACGREANG